MLRINIILLLLYEVSTIFILLLTYLIRKLLCIYRNSLILDNTLYYIYIYMFYYFIDVTVARITCIKLLIELQHMVCFLFEYFKIL